MENSGNKKKYINIKVHNYKYLDQTLEMEDTTEEEILSRIKGVMEVLWNAQRIITN